MRSLTLIATITTLLLLTTGAYATCLSVDQILTLVDIANATNTSYITLVGVFDMLCNRTYTKADIDSYQNLMWNLTKDYIDDTTMTKQEIQGYTENYTSSYLQNYTTWFENQTDLIDVLEAMVDLINTTHNIDVIIDEVVAENLVLEDRIDEKLMKFKDDYATEEQLQQQYQNLTLLVYSYNRPSPPADYTGFYFIAMLVAVAAVILYIKRKSLVRTGSAPKEYKKQTPYKSKIVSSGEMITPGALKEEEAAGGLLNAKRRGAKKKAAKDNTAN